MLTKIYEVRKAVEYELYNCALVLALTLPDSCALAEYNGEKNRKEYYIKWFNKYAKPLFTNEATVLPGNTQNEVVWLDGEKCWKLRCTVLHSGSFKLKGNQTISLHVHLGNSYIKSHSFKGDNHLEYELKDLCFNICDAVEKYYNENKEIMDTYIDNVRILE